MPQGAGGGPCAWHTGPGQIHTTESPSATQEPGDVPEATRDPGARVTPPRPDQGWLQWDRGEQTGLSAPDAEADDDNYLHLYHA